MKIDESVDCTIDKVIDLLQRLIKIDSQNRQKEYNCPFGKGVKEALDFVLSYCKKLGFRVKNLDNYIGWAEVGQGEEMIGIPMHLDIVPQGKGWNVDPFGGEIVDKIIYGRGAVDNKGPVAMLIHVVNNIKEQCPNLRKRIRLIFGTNEETGMECIKYYLKVGEEIPTMGFTPDAMFPVVNGEKGRLHIYIEKNVELDTRGCYVKLNGGTKENVVPSECFTKICNIDLQKLIKLLDDKKCINDISLLKRLKKSKKLGLPRDAEGKNIEHDRNFDVSKDKELCKNMDVDRSVKLVKTIETDNSIYLKKSSEDMYGNDLCIETLGTSAHGSTPEKGDNAISKMLYILRDLTKYDIDIQNIDYINKIYDLLGIDYNGKGLGIYSEDDIFKKNTVNLGVLNIDEGKIVIELDIRYGMSINEEEILDRIKKSFGQDWKISVLNNKKLHYVNESTEIINKLLQAYEEITGEKGYCFAMGGGTYASSFDNMVAFGPKFLDYRTGGHGIDERVPIAHLKLNMKIYTKAILNLLDR